jgi:putative methylase
MKLRQLEMKLERLKGFEQPVARLEQYQTPSPVAARLLFHAYMQGAIEGRRVCDLGCGTGVLSCGAALLGADYVLGIDIDPAAVAIAVENAAMLGVNPIFRVGEITDPDLFSGELQFETVVMNPPFGAQEAHADRPFIDRALSIADTVYGIFNAGSASFIGEYTRGRAEIEEVIRCQFPIRRTFAFHTRDKVDIEVDVIRLRRC